MKLIRVASWSDRGYDDLDVLSVVYVDGSVEHFTEEADHNRIMLQIEYQQRLGTTFDPIATKMCLLFGTDGYNSPIESANGSTRRLSKGSSTRAGTDDSGIDGADSSFTQKLAQV